MRLGATPVHIPNTMVKTQTADDTILVTVWESRWLPDYKRNLPAIGTLKSIRLAMTGKKVSQEL